MKVAIVGATGFVGRFLIHELLQSTDFDVIALSRRKLTSKEERIECRQADIYSLLQVEKAIFDCDVAVYLVHSMAPAARLAQGGFQDFDYILADNFIRAAQSCALKKIIYVGGIIPKKGKLSPHLKSRLEVEKIFTSSKISTLNLRCALVIGPQGSSFDILIKLIKRLPIMLLPKWMATKMQPISVYDLVKILRISIEKPDFEGTYNAHGKDVLSYRQLVLSVAKKLKKKIFVINFPFNFFVLSKFWVRSISGKSKELVYPLIESVIHDMTGKSQSKKIPESIYSEYRCYEALVQESLMGQLPSDFWKKAHETSLKEEFLVKSVQRLCLPFGWSADKLSRFYLKWLSRWGGALIDVHTNGNKAYFKILFVKKPLLILELSLSRSQRGRPLFYILGGVLDADVTEGRLEFRESYHKLFVIAAIHNFKPSLPWWLYRVTQAPIHKYVMKRFNKDLKKIDALRKKRLQAKESRLI